MHVMKTETVMAFPIPMILSSHPDPEQLDSDEDGLGNACNETIDRDQDGLPAHRPLPSYPKSPNRAYACGHHAEWGHPWRIGSWSQWLYGQLAPVSPIGLPLRVLNQEDEVIAETVTDEAGRYSVGSSRWAKKAIDCGSRRFCQGGSRSTTAVTMRLVTPSRASRSL